MWCFLGEYNKENYCPLCLDLFFSMKVLSGHQGSLVLSRQPFCGAVVVPFISEASKLKQFCHVQVVAVREGMSTIIPVPLLSLLAPQQLEQLVCGLPEVSVQMLKKLVRYRDVTESHQLISWFWQSLEEFTNEERVLFLRFVSGRSRLPSNPADITQKFQIIKVDRVRSFLATTKPSYKSSTSKHLIISLSPSTASQRLRPASFYSVCPRTRARPSWARGCATPSTTVPPSTWTTTCWPTTPSQRTAPAQTTEAGSYGQQGDECISLAHYALFFFFFHQTCMVVHPLYVDLFKYVCGYGF